MTRSVSAHPSPRQLTDFAQGKLPEGQAVTVADHLGSCSTCLQQVEQIEQAAPGSFAGRVRQAGPADPPPAPPSRLQSRVSAAGAAAAPLAAAQVPPALRQHPKYKVLKLLGQGGMGAVFLAQHNFLNTRVALKVIAPALLQHPEALARFHEERQNAAKLDHPNIVRALDADQVGDLHLFVMEYVEGMDLDRAIRKAKGAGKRIQPAAACRWVRQAALALQHAHERGMVHRDIKPANLMLTRDEQVKILDFGLAKLVDEEAHREAKSVFGFKGTPDYASPEQFNDARQADIRSDIYSLGCTLYALLTGRPPFVEDDPVKTALAHLDKVPPPLADFRPGLPEGLQDVVSRMLAKEPEERYQTPAEVADALAPFAGEKKESDMAAASPFRDLGVGTVLPQRTPTRGIRSSPETAMKPLPGGWRGRGSSNTWLVASAAGAAAALILLGFFLYFRFTGRDGKTVEFSFGSGRGPEGAGNGDDPGKKTATGPALHVVKQPAAGEVLDNSIGMELAYIRAGKFTMGSPADEVERKDHEGPEHEVEITWPFRLGVYEVTQEQYEKVMGTNPSHFSRNGEGSGIVAGLDTSRFPVELVSWHDAVEFCKRLSAMPEEKKAGRVYRLPTEAEWEYGCRGGGRNSRPFSIDKQFATSLSSRYANFNGHFPYGGAPKGEFVQRPVPVGSYEANRLGLHDMHANVNEWCADWYDRDYYKSSPRQDPKGPEEGSRRVVRGGSWFFGGQDCRSAYRHNNDPTDRYHGLGFRVAMDLLRDAPGVKAGSTP